MKQELDAKKWSRIAVYIIVGILLAAALTVVVVDPFFHFHKPLNGLQYPLTDERYMNDGLARHMEYSAIITGSSTSQNFKASQFDALFDTNTIKQTYPSGTYNEIAKSLERAFSYQGEVEYVLWGLDLTRINCEADAESYTGIPYYLYDENPFNDVTYILNMDALRKCFTVINYTRAGNKTTTMDDYGAWYPWAEYGREQVLKGLIDYSSFTQEIVLSEEDKAIIRENVTKNIVETANNHPNTQFYIYYTPSSAAFWYGMLHTLQLGAQIEAERLATSLILECPNVHLFGFADHIDMTGNLDNYMDTLHYSEKISEQIMQWMHDGVGELTKENYDDYYNRLYDIYENYDYGYEE